MFRPFVLLLLAIAATGGVCAQDNTPTLRGAQAGFTGQFRNRNWTPLHLLVENPGPARQALLVAETDGVTSGQRLQFTRPVFLPAQSILQVELPILPDLLPRPPERVRFSSVANVRLTDGGVQTWGQTEVIGSQVPEDAFFALLTDTNFTGYRHLRDFTVGPERRNFARAQVAPKNLPRRPLELRGFDAIVLGHPGETELSPLQLHALRDYVEQGGHLLVLPTCAPGVSPALAELLPGTFVSPQRVETLPAVAGEFIFTNGLAVARLVAERGEVLFGTRDSPWALVRSVGAGRVTMLGFDAGSEEFSIWPGAKEFWREQFGAGAPLLHNADRLLTRSPQAERVLASLSGLKVPARGTVLLYLAGVCGGLLLVLGAFRFTTRPERGWAVAAIFALVTGVSAVAAANRWKSAPEPFLNEVHVTTARSGADTGRVQALLGVFSPAERSYQLRTAADTASLSPGRSRLTPPETLRLDYEAQQSVSNLAVRADDQRTLVGRAPKAETRAPAFHARLGEDGLSLTLTNRSDAPLSAPFLKFNRFVIPLPDVPPGGRLERSGLRVNAHETTTGLVRSTREQERERLREAFFPTPVYSAEFAQSYDERRFARLLRGRELLPVLFSWSDAPAFPLAAIEPPAARRAIGLLAVEGELDYAGPTLLLPAGVMPAHTRNLDAYAYERGDGCYAGGRPAHLGIEFTLPPGCPPLEARELTIHFEFRGAAFEPAIHVAPGDFPLQGEIGQLLSRMTKLPAGLPARVPEPGRLLGAGRRSVLVVVSVAHSAEGKRLGHSMNPNLHTWQVRHLDLELKGVTP